jgi:hypothetical protein
MLKIIKLSDLQKNYFPLETLNIFLSLFGIKWEIDEESALKYFDKFDWSKFGKYLLSEKLKLIFIEEQKKLLKYYEEDILKFELECKELRESNTSNFKKQENLLYTKYNYNETKEGDYYKIVIDNSKGDFNQEKNNLNKLYFEEGNKILDNFYNKIQPYKDIYLKKIASLFVKLYSQE